MILYPNAKINIGLQVLNKRDDGYHDICSVFYPLFTFIDILEIIPSDTFQFNTSGIFIPEGKNLCVKAWEILNKDFGIDNVSIHLHKKIPIGSGLGGGSSDGSFTLIALNKIFNLNLDDTLLKKYALELGADCPFFIENSPNIIKGVGDIMSPVNLNLDTYEIRVIDSKFHISTSDVYRFISPNNSRDCLENLLIEPVDRWRDIIENDFESYVFSQYKSLKKIKENLYREGAVYVSMTGTGSAIYAIFEK
tara:strand:- start:13654 stop:14403 length:750 start_codon:yes stop_codon:yes gene_type:complete